jgi:hypothetical protein
MLAPYDSEGWNPATEGILSLVTTGGGEGGGRRRKRQPRVSRVLHLLPLFLTRVPLSQTDNSETGNEIASQ